MSKKSLVSSMIIQKYSMKITVRQSLLFVQHMVFRVAPGNFLSREIGCPHCGRDVARKKRRDNYTEKRKVEGCGTNQFNVNGYATKHPHLLRQLFK
jgi:hypothetical protein